MSPQASEAKKVFLEAVEEYTPDQWPRFLDEACRGDLALRDHVEALLKAHGESNPMLDGTGVVPAASLFPIAERPGQTIERYKLLEEIGEGGFGVVYMAEQREPVRRKVALKIIKPGMDTKEVVARFEAERQALAMMDHPNIAKVLDAGATESGRPYFVMELVHGTPLTEYCDQNELTIDQRLELFTSVCQAIQHAHQKGIIHRDIKPSNVMVTLHDGVPVPKIIDFGIAKATDRHLTERTVFTSYGQMVGTPLYMSPEQAELSGLGIDTRSDIYSLGVLLYELLTGSTPFDKERIREAGLDEMRQMIREEELPRPSGKISTLANETATAISANRQTDPARLSHLLRGELDWILMKALEKDRTRRYETANGFAADIERYRKDEPVEACPPSTAYRIGKFARRNKGTLLVCVVVAAALLAGTVVSLWQLHEANKARQVALAHLLDADERREQAEANLSLALRVLDELYLQVIDKDRVFSEEHPDGATKQLSESEQQLVRTGLRLYETLCKQNSDNPQAELATARAFARTADIYRALGRHRDAEAAYATAVHRLTKLTTKFPTRRDYRDDLVATYIGRSRLPWSRATAGRRQADLEKAIELDPKSDTAHLLLARLCLRYPEPSKRDLKRAIQHAETAVRIGPRNPEDPATVGWVYKTRGDVYSLLGRYQGALAEYDEAIRLAPTWRAYAGRGKLHRRLGRYEEALADYDRSLESGCTHWFIYKRRGSVHFQLKHYDEALADIAKAVELKPKDLTNLTWIPPSEVAACRNEQFKNGILALADKSIETTNGSPGSFLVRADIRAAFGRKQDALDDLKNVISMIPRYSASSRLSRTEEAKAYWVRGKAYLEMGDLEKAIADFDQSVQLDPERDIAYCDRGNAYQAKGELDKAMADYERATQVSTHREWPYLMRGLLHAKLGNIDQARADFETALRLQPRKVPIYNAYSWMLVTLPDPQSSDLRRAVEVAQEAVRRAPEHGVSWNTLGVAQYRAGNWKATLDALEKSGKLKFSLVARTEFFAAMAHWQLDQKQEARQWYDKAVEWMDENKPEDEELGRFRAEAAELLGITETPSEKPEQEEEETDQTTTDESGTNEEETADAPAGEDSPSSAETGTE